MASNYLNQIGQIGNNSDITSSISGITPGGSTQIVDVGGNLWNVSLGPNGTYSYSSPQSGATLGVGMNQNQINGFLTGNSVGSFQPSANTTPQFGIGNPNYNGAPLTQAQVMAAQTNGSQSPIGFGGSIGDDGNGAAGGSFGGFTPQQLGQGVPEWIKDTGLAGTMIMGSLIGAAAGPALGGAILGEGAAGSGTLGAGLVGAAQGAGMANGTGGNPLTGALTGGVSSGLMANYSPMNAISNQFPETIGSINPFSASNDLSSSDINWNPDLPQGPNLPAGSGSGFTSGGMSLPGSISSPASVGTSPSSAPSFGPSSFASSPSPLASPSPLSSSDPFGGSSASIPNPMGANISGAGSSSASPSIFDSLMKGDVSGAASGVGNYVANSPLTTLAGGAAIAGGLSKAGLFGGANSPSQNDQTANSTFTPTPFNPSEQSQSSLPGSLSSYSGLDPFQQATNLATRGVYGGGNGPQENNYFLNLINRQLYDQTGNLANDNSSINPVENSYLSQLGITGKNPTDILKGISQYGT